ncbi:MAG: hypothetical protein C5B50_18135 [Verrucomicrobia bacterium]|nr:MAG: hypothetical protein C5B50_18135 [Verrucomicrobiota bacterium]
MNFELGTLSHRPRHIFAVLTALAALVLIGLGGLVTSKEAGLAVPDWPTSFGYNMFFLPISKWVGGIFYEHTHRLVASGVGLMTTILALWLYGRNSRLLMRWAGLSLFTVGAVAGFIAPKHWSDALVLAAAGLAAFGASFVWPMCEPAPKWLRRLGLAAFFAVILQGVLGGVRVVWLKDQIGIFHAALAQIFFVLLCAIALFTSRRWARLNASQDENRNRATELPPGLGVRSRSIGSALDGWARKLKRQRTGALQDAVALSDSALDSARLLVVGTTLLIFVQLLLGATMRHQHAGLAIPDFPLAYGKLWPAIDVDSVAHYNSQRIETTAVNPITATQIALQMAHRAMAVLISIAVAVCVWTTRRRLGSSHPAGRLALVWLSLLVLQVVLGAATIWSNKAADIATAHVVIGALSLVLGTYVSIFSWARCRLAGEFSTVRKNAGESPGRAGHPALPSPRPVPAS